MGLQEDFVAMLADGLQANTLTSCSRWACKRRVMGSPFPGPFTFKHHPWTREIHDAQEESLCIQKAAQLGLSEYALNVALFSVVEKQLSALYVLPSTGNASDFSKSRFNPAIENSKYLTNVFTDLNSISLKQCGNATLFIRGSRSDSGLKSIAVSCIIADEIDEFSKRAVALLRERSSGQVNRQLIALSTPTIPNFGISALYADSTQEHFAFECPRCGRLTELIWPDCVEIIGERVDDPRVHESFLKCKECGGKLEHFAKPDFLKNGFWVRTNQEGNPAHRGFYINQLYSCTITPGELVKQYFRGFGNEAEAVEFHNSKLGLPFLGDGAKLADGDIDQCIRDHSKDDPRPQDASRLITLGCDQGKTNYVEIAEWFFDGYSSDINVAAHCKVLWEGTFSEEDWDFLDSLMREWQIRHAVIDADPSINDARRFARRFPKFVTLCRFRSGVTAKEISTVNSDDDAPIVHVDRSNWFSAALGRFRSNRIELPRDVSQTYRDHIKAPVRTYKRDENDNPRAVYVSTGPDHFGLARVYNEIALPLAASFTTGRNVEQFL